MVGNLKLRNLDKSLKLSKCKSSKTDKSKKRGYKRRKKAEDKSKQEFDIIPSLTEISSKCPNLKIIES